MHKKKSSTEKTKSVCMVCVSEEAPENGRILLIRLPDPFFSQLMSAAAVAMTVPFPFPPATPTSQFPN